MGTKEKEDIKVWRRDGLAGIEFRRGVAVSEPYPRHWHDEYQLCLVSDGGGELFYRGSRHGTPTGSLFIVHPGEVHSNQTATGCSFRSIYIEPDLVREMLGEFCTGNDLPFFWQAVMFDIDVIADYLSLHYASENGSSSLEREVLARRFLFRLILKGSGSRVNVSVAGDESASVRRVREYITEHHERSISLRELEQLTGLSPFHLTRVFSKTVGMPPHEFQTQVRVAAAKRLIRKGHPIAEAAAAAGFADQSHFHRHFRRLMKITPGEYSKNSKNVQ